MGEFGNLQEAISRLSVAVPLSIALIILLLYLNFHSLRDALLAASVIPMALLGGIFALWVTGTAFSEPRLIELAYSFEHSTKRRVPPPSFP